MRAKLPWLLAVITVAPVMAAEKPVITAPPEAAAVVTLGWRLQGTDGFRPRAGQYVAPWTGVTLDIERFDLRTPKGYDVIDVWTRDFLGERSDAMVALWNPALPMMLRATWDRAMFFNEPLAPLPGLSRRTNTAYDLRVRPGLGSRVGTWFKQERVNHPTQIREGAYSYSTEEFGGSFDLPLGPGVLGLKANSLAFRERVAGRLPSQTQMYDISYHAVLGSRWLFGGAAQWTLLRQPGLAGSELFQAGAMASYQPAKNLWTEARFTLRDIDLGPTANAYVTKSLGGGLSLIWKPSTTITWRGGLERQQLERYNAIQSAVEKPHETRAWTRLDFRTKHNLRVSGEYQFKTVNNLDNSAAPLIGDARPLFLDTEHKLKMRGSLNLGPSGMAYGFFQHRYRRAQARGFGETMQSYGLGYSYALTPQVSLSGDVYFRDLSVSSATLTGLDADGLVLHAGIAWQPSLKWRLWADYNLSESYYGDDTDQHYVNAGLTTALGGGRELRFTYQLQDLDSTLLPGLRYDTNILNFSFASPF
ncbi:MAG: hypothetical protein IT204_14655 [Fimbriimonadaceae bacterium]|nr:hypothetical protein [Fimbriimonadaceae bacterium]